jgi:transcription antitermination factor NusG
MQKNWYVIYTKPKCEKKVGQLLSKRKIENFIPLNGKLVKDFRKRKIIYEPLFQSYVFVCIEEDRIPFLQQIEGVVSLVYWRGKPAIIHGEEIEAIREFTADHQNIKLEKTHVNVNHDLKIADGPTYTMGEKILIIKNRSFNVTLPSLGFTMIAELEMESVRGLDISFGNKELLLQTQS